ncbi:MAG: GTPase HflX [Myxococcota bacterium]
MATTEKPRPRAVLLGVQLPTMSDGDFRSSLDELERLATTLGFEVVGRVTQRRARLAPGAVVGSGKLVELARWTGGTGIIQGKVDSKDDEDDEDERGTGRGDETDDEALDGDAEASVAREDGLLDLARARSRAAARRARGEREDEAEDEDGFDDEDGLDDADAEARGEPRATIVLVDQDISPSQSRNLERATGVEVLDRTAVILAIFQRHARSREARLQVEIARLEYMAPRLRETGGGRDRQGGGIGGRGAGESASELDRRKVRDRIAELRQELAAIERESGTRRKRREDVNTVALVGYTNAGKSSWMRALTGSGVLVEDKLFATLGTTVRTLKPETATRVLVSDTVGFIKHLPHDLVASFRSTLEEARDCSLLVHVVDASDPAFQSQIDVTREVLASIGADENPHLIVLNKADRLDELTRVRVTKAYPEALLLSAHSPEDVATLRARIVAFFERDMEEVELLVPYAASRVVAMAHEQGTVLAEAYEADGVRLRVRASASVLAKLRTELGG